MSRYALSPNAARSLEGISDYSLGEFGQQQAIRYLTMLNDKFEYLAQSPERGTKRDEIKSGYLSYFVGSHTVYYKIAEDGILIIDILLQAMEPRRHLL
jgi:toxin ParE1/3/4